MTQMLDQVFRGSPHAVVIVSSYDGSITWISAAQDAVHGEWVGRPLRELVDLWGLDYETSAVAQLLDNPDLDRVVEAGVHDACRWVVASRLVGEEPHEIIGTLHAAGGTREQALADHQLMAGVAAAAMEYSEARMAQRAAERAIFSAGQRLDRMAELLLAQAAGAWATRAPAAPVETPVAAQG